MFCLAVLKSLLRKRKIHVYLKTKMIIDVYVVFVPFKPLPSYMFINRHIIFSHKNVFIRMLSLQICERALNSTKAY